jgi:HSP20 family protein
MNNLTRWDPVRDMLTMRETMDKIFDSFFDNQTGRTTGSWSLPLDVIENEDEFVIKASIPGVKPEDLDITYTNHTLTIRGESKSERDVDEARYHLRERRYGRFERSIHLPTEVNADRIDASYDAGVLSLRLPKIEEVKPRRIAIKSGNGQKMIEGSMKDAK